MTKLKCQLQLHQRFNNTFYQQMHFAQQYTYANYFLYGTLVPWHLGSGEISWNPKVNGAEPDLIAFCI